MDGAHFPLPEHFDVLIVGAGLSGVGAGVHLQQRCPGKSYVILESREGAGGTWDLFRYPGIRSDSDMFTLGYNFKPWTNPKAIADGTSIRGYVEEAAREYRIDRHIRFKHTVKRASWDSATARWTIDAERDGAAVRFTANFLMMCAGYYRYDQGYLPDFPGAERFAGALIHPQHWPDDFDYAGKRVIVIGSGATAVTLVPAMAEKAAHVTMLQRSPTYMASLPAEDSFANTLRRVLPARWAYHLTRFKQIVLSQFLYRLARARPRKVRERVLSLIREQLGPEADLSHFSPRYNPWDERFCLVPDNDMFLAIRAGKASVVTDAIETFTERGVKLGSGRELEGDIIVTATGLNLQMFGGADILVDGARIESGDLIVYRGAMYAGLPNFANVFGYTNASWTLRADLISEYVCRLLNYMDASGYVEARPRAPGPEIERRPFVDFSSGYFKRVAHLLPKQTVRTPWKLNQSYLHDIAALRFGRLDDGVLAFKRRSNPVTTAEAGSIQQAAL